MKRLKYALAAALLLAGCRDKEELIYPNIVATMDQIVDDDAADGSKIVLYHDEEWLKWEAGDKIAVYSINSSNKFNEVKEMQYVDGDGARMAYMHIIPEGSAITAGKTYYAVYPNTLKYNYSSGASLGPNELKVNLPASHTYRPSDNAYADSSFGIGAIPMVSFQGDEDDDGNGDLDSVRFHMVAGIMRLQFWGQDASLYTIKQLTLQSVNLSGDGIDDAQLPNTRALSGTFDVRRLQFINPYLAERFVAPGSADSKVTYTFDDDGRPLGSTGNGQLWTLYVPLPAQGTAKDPLTHYKFYMTLKLQNGGTVKYLKKGITVDIRRQNITMMPAIGFNISDLSDNESWDGSSAGVDVGLVGNGTRERPYRIYTGKELDLVRRAFKTGTPVINGQEVTEDTYFEIVRSDIHLVTKNQRDSIRGTGIDTNTHPEIIHWHEGIQNFKGRLQFKSSSTVMGGIMNTSDVPLFASITNQGHIERVQIRGNIRYTGTAVFSPLCRVNRGEMIDCHVKCNISATNASSIGIAGLCVDNYGTIVGGANEGTLKCPGNVCGCVYNNFGTVQGSFSLSSAVPEGSNIAGICMHNYGTMQYCQVESNTNPNSTGNWGVIAFFNHPDTTVNGNHYGVAKVDRCISSGSVVFSTTGSIGGIVHTNGGIVKNCSNKVTLRGAAGSIGGIVAVMYDGEVYNCDAEGNHWIDGTGGAVFGHVAENAGGIVGYLRGGTISNSYNQCRVDGATNSGGIVGDFEAGTVIQNVWSAFGHNFIGNNTSLGTVDEFCFSAHLEDYSRGCNTLDTASGIRYHIHQMQTAQNAAYAADNPGGDLVGTYLGIALNYWVGKHSTASDGGSYYTWNWTNEQSMPRLVMPDYPAKSHKGSLGTGNRRYTKVGALPEATQRRFNQRIRRK